MQEAVSYVRVKSGSEQFVVPKPSPEEGDYGKPLSQ